MKDNERCIIPGGIDGRYLLPESIYKFLNTDFVVLTFGFSRNDHSCWTARMYAEEEWEVVRANIMNLPCSNAAVNHMRRRLLGFVAILEIHEGYIRIPKTYRKLIATSADLIVERHENFIEITNFVLH